MKNNFEVIVQPLSLFDVTADKFVSYKHDADFEKQGTVIRARFTDTVTELKTAIAIKCGLTDEFDLIEVQRC
jgi:hypothetical protein